MDCFKYPIATEEELLDFFNSNFLMNITFDSYIKPTKELVCAIYDKFLFDFGIEYRVPQLKAVQTENMAMNSTSFPYINLKAALSSLLESSGFCDFSFNDLSKPQRRRNQIIFSQLAGLWSRFFELQEKWKIVAADNELRARRKNEIHRRIEEKKKLLEEKLLESSELAEQMPVLEREVTEAAEQFNAVKTKSANLKSKQEKLKLNIMQKKEKVAELQEKKAKLEEQLEEAESKLVRSPEKVFAETTRKEKLRDEVRAEKQASSKLLMEKQAELNALKEEFADDKQITKALEEFRNLLKKIRDNCMAIDKAEKENAAKEMEISQLDVQIAKVNEIREGVEKRKLTDAKSHEQRMSTLKDMITEMEKRIDELEAEKLSSNETTESTVKKLLHQLDELKLNHEETDRTYKELIATEEMEFVKFGQSTLPALNKLISSYNNQD